MNVEQSVYKEWCINIDYHSYNIIDQVNTTA